MELTRNFILQEFVDPDIYALLGDKCLALIDNRIIGIAQVLRDYFGVPVTINNWYEGGNYKESGLRKFLSNTGAQFSQHKFGRAIDMKLEDMDAEEVRKEVIRKWKMFRGYGLTTMESGTPTWVHVDCRYTGMDELLIVPFN